MVNVHYYNPHYFFQHSTNSNRYTLLKSTLVVRYFFTGNEYLSTSSDDVDNHIIKTVSPHRRSNAYLDLLTTVTVKSTVFAI